jgi:adenylate cyclase
MTFRHRLAAVWFADIVDYTALSTADEARAIRLARSFQTAARDNVERYGGRVVKFLGDGALAEFASIHAAIASAHALRGQFDAEAQAAGVPGGRLRIGVHSGEIVESEDGDLYGAGVNTASRIAQEAREGDIVVSQDVWRQARQRTEFAFESLGSRDLKGTGQLELYRVDVLEPIDPESLVVETPDETETMSWRSRLGGRMTMAAVFTVSVLIAAAVLHFVTRDASQPPAVKAETETPAPAVAVLPFHVSGTGSIDDWREGMIDLLSTNLDGVGGLRAIESRTILARWDEHAGREALIDADTALDIGRSAGARYAVLGSAIGMGSSVRIVADVYDLRSGRRLGQSRVEGAADSVFALIDHLTIDLIGQMGVGETGRSGSVSLARVTTDSLEALKAFLEGEAKFRRSDFAGAHQAFQRAAEIDSTFALALFRMGQAVGFGGFGPTLELFERAVRYGQRLPERERLVLQGALAREHGKLEAIPFLERATRLYPDDAIAWFELGEAYHHLGAQALLEHGVSEPAFEHALAIDPDFSPAYIHLIENAFTLHADARRARRLLDAFVARAPESIEARMYPNALALAFGDSSVRSRAWSAFQGGNADEVVLTARNLFWHPRLLGLQQAVYDRYRADAALSADAHLQRGRLAEALKALNDPTVSPQRRAIRLYQAYAWGLPVPDAALESALGPAAPLDTSPVSLFFRGAYAADRGRWREHDGLVRSLEASRDSLGGADAPGAAGFASGAGLALRGYRQWREGRAAEAYATLELARRSATGFWDPRQHANATIRRWLAQLASELEKPHEVAYWQSFWGTLEVFRPLARLELARAYEHADEGPPARAARGEFAIAWADADPGLRARMESRSRR